MMPDQPAAQVTRQCAKSASIVQGSKPWFPSAPKMGGIARCAMDCPNLLAVLGGNLNQLRLVSSATLHV